MTLKRGFTICVYAVVLILCATPAGFCDEIIAKYGNWTLTRQISSQLDPASFCSLSNNFVKPNDDRQYANQSLILVLEKNNSFYLGYFTNFVTTATRIEATFAFSDGIILNVEMVNLGDTFSYHASKAAEQIAISKDIAASNSLTLTIPEMVNASIQLGDSDIALKALHSCADGLSN